MNTLLTIPEERTRTPRRHESTTKPPAPLSSGRLSRLQPALQRNGFDSIRQGGPTRTSADVSVPRLAGFPLITVS